MRILYHAINGGGLGHLVRLSNIALEVRALDPSVHQMMVTNSAADYLDGLGLPALQLPADDTISAAGPDRRARTVSYRLSVQILYRAIVEYNPDVIVLDTHFSISLLRQLLKEKRCVALVLREVKASYLEEKLAGPELAQLKRILVPHSPEDFRSAVPGMASRLEALPAFRYTGPIVRRVDASPESMERVAARHGIAPGERLILVTCGGGGYQDAIDELLRFASSAARLAASRTGAVVIVVTGPYAPPDSVFESCRVVRWEPELPLLMARADLVVTHAGYNSVNEVLASGSRAVLIPAARKHEDQSLRASRLERAGRVRCLGLDAPLAIAAACFEEEMEKPRFQPETFTGGRCAAAELITLRQRPLFVCSAQAVPQHARPFADVESLTSDIQRHSPCDVLVDASVFSKLIEDGSLFSLECAAASVTSWAIRLSGDSPDEIARSALAILDEFKSVGLDPSRLILAYSDPCSGKWLPGISESLAAHSFQALAAELPRPSHSPSNEESFGIFERWRNLGRKFRMDICTSGCPLVDQP